MTAHTYAYKDPILTLNGVSISFNGESILRDINAQVLDVVRPNMSQGQVVGFYGRSGIGKSVLCRIMAGLIAPSTGTVEVGLAQQAVEPGMVGFVQQRYPLFDHRTLHDNLLVAAQRKHAPAEARQHVESYLERFGGITMNLTEADDQITEGLPYLKAALLTKFKKGKDKAMYPQFGIITRAGGYELPLGHTERALALQTLVAGLTTHSLTAGDYGTTFWAPIAAAYHQDTQAAKASAASVSGLVGTKDVLEAQVDMVLTKMLVLLEAQYPDETELAAKRRELGYLKEFN